VGLSSLFSSLDQLLLAEWLQRLTRGGWENFSNVQQAVIFFLPEAECSAWAALIGTYMLRSREHFR